MQLDTLDAVLAVATHPLVAGLSVVAGPLGARLPARIELLPDAGGGLNPALTAAAGELAERYPDVGVVALVGDLPALRPADLLAALTEADRHPRSFVRDLAGSGTTLLAAAAGVALDPQVRPGLRAAACRVRRGRTAGCAPACGPTSTRARICGSACNSARACSPPRCFPTWSSEAGPGGRPGRMRPGTPVGHHRRSVTR